MWIGYALAVGAAITWGLVYALDQKILERVSPFTLLFVSSVCAALLMLPFALTGSGSLKAALAMGKDGIALLAVTAILTALAGILILLSIKRLDASTTSIIEISYPFFVVLFSYVIFRSVPNVAFFMGGALVVCGTFIIIRYAS